jgi:TRAP-type C4-dicarboxylate transport system substrate-binding protein
LRQIGRRPVDSGPAAIDEQCAAAYIARWKRLTPEQQTIFREESKNSGELMRKLIADAESDQIDKLQKAGMQITRPDLAPFRAKMEPAYKRIADYAGEDNVKKFREIVDKFHKA